LLRTETSTILAASAAAAAEINIGNEAES